MSNLTSNRAKGMSGNRHLKKTDKLTKDSIARYLRACKKAKLKVEPASPKKDIKEHTDYIVDGKTVDLKSMKESARDGLVLLEFRNVNGKEGWCNESNKPEWIAFDFGAFFLHAKNTDLFNLAKDKCDLKDRTYKFNDCLYKGYQRRGRKDWMSMVKLQDVLNECEHWFLPHPIRLD
mgnify:FL=1|tara:strand:- start:443 stop:973 length:531 start_codon:yes stop_codon:yes gene_type:complete